MIFCGGGGKKRPVQASGDGAQALPACALLGAGKAYPTCAVFACTLQDGQECLPLPDRLEAGATSSLSLPDAVAVWTFMRNASRGRPGGVNKYFLRNKANKSIRINVSSEIPTKSP